MRYEMLGPLRVIDDGKVSSISARKVETLLAVLLIRADQDVSAEQLANELWEDNRPRRATAGLHVYVSQLRKFLGRPDRPASPIVTRPPGYRFLTGTDEVDVHRFMVLAKQGREHARDRWHEGAAACFDRALALCRGPVLQDLPRGPIVDGFVTWFTEQRMECVEMAVEAHLSLGRHREMTGWLYSLTAEYPLREAFHRQLMLALYRSERQADALKVYQIARSLLNRELGLEPCRALRDLHRAILLADESLDFVAPAQLAVAG